MLLLSLDSQLPHSEREVLVCSLYTVVNAFRSRNGEISLVRMNPAVGCSLGAAPTQRLLTSHELLILQLFARGYSREQIADVLGAGLHEVGHHGARAAGALGVSTVGEAVRCAQRRGLID